MMLTEGPFVRCALCNYIIIEVVGGGWAHWSTAQRPPSDHEAQPEHQQVRLL